MLSQIQIISKVLEKHDYSIILLNNLEAKHFFNCKSEFLFIKNHYEQYNAVPDKITFLKNFPEFNFVEVTEPDSYLIAELMKDYNQSYIVGKINKQLKKYLETGDIDKAITEIKDIAEKIDLSTGTRCIDLLKDTSRYDHYLEKASNPTKYYISTGFPELDKVIGGIDTENEDLCIVSRPGNGKTYIMLAMIASALKQGKRVLMYEGEMTADKIGYRLDTLLGHLKNTSINRGDLFVQKEYKNYIDNLKNANLGQFYFFTPNDVGGEVTVDTIESMAAKIKPDIIFIDQYSLLEDKHHASIEHERVGNIAKDIKKLQVKLRLPIISISQQNRTKNEDNTQDTTQVAGSDKIPQYATVVIMLEQKYIEETKSVELTFNITKARDGGSNNKLTYRADLNTGTFQYIMHEGDSVSTAEDFEKKRKEYEVSDDNGEIKNVF